MEIRNSREEDLQKILEIYESARAYLTNPTASHGGCVTTHNPIGST